MSIGPTGGILGSAAGAPLSQTKGAETEKNAQQSSAAERKADTELKSEKASGIGTTEEDQATEDRDADGRRLWEDTSDGENETQEATEPGSDKEPAKSKDPRGEAGNQLDLMG